MSRVDEITQTFNECGADDQMQALFRQISFRARDDADLHRGLLWAVLGAVIGELRGLEDRQRPDLAHLPMSTFNEHILHTLNEAFKRDEMFKSWTDIKP